MKPHYGTATMDEDGNVNFAIDVPIYDPPMTRRDNMLAVIGGIAGALLLAAMLLTVRTDWDQALGWYAHLVTICLVLFYRRG